MDVSLFGIARNPSAVTEEIVLDWESFGVKKFHWKVSRVVENWMTCFDLDLEYTPFIRSNAAVASTAIKFLVTFVVQKIPSNCYILDWEVALYCSGKYNIAMRFESRIVYADHN